MRIFKSLGAVALMLAALFVWGTSAQAQRPHYMHALSNLRQARALLETDTRPGFVMDRDRAMEEVDNAIREVKMAARDEGRNPRFTPPPASAGDPDRPMRSALSLLDDARDDIARGEDVGEDRGLQNRALKHIDEARHALGHALHKMEHEHRY
jgi:hypothetical protein